MDDGTVRQRRRRPPGKAGVAELDLANIYARHRQGLFTLALLITRRPDRAEDAVHDAFARLCGVDSRGIADPVAYVFAAVRRAAIDQVRRAKRTGADEAAVSIFAAGDGATPESSAMGAERTQWVMAAIEALPPDQREVVVLRVYAELTFAQIAEVLAQPLATVAARYRRSLERLRGQLEKLV
jgi:RNA polymerase sigma-70 factor, ECF subfamily